MLVAIALLLLILAIAGGVAVNPLLFLIALLAVLVFVGGGRRGTPSEPAPARGGRWEASTASQPGRR